jgi:hypothetical protein
MDGAWIGSVDISISKAWTARAFDIQTRDLGDNSQPGQQFFGISASNAGKVMIFAGGIPLERDGQVLGGLGVSGGTGEQDQAVAEAGVVALRTNAILADDGSSAGMALCRSSGTSRGAEPSRPRHPSASVLPWSRE